MNDKNRQGIVGPADPTLDGPPPAVPDQTHAESAAGGETDWLALLSPPQEPGSLGRLGQYEILELAGRGAMGLVFRARDTVLQRVVAVKLLAPQLAVSATARRRFVREARAAAAVRDDHVVAIHDVQDAGPAPYLVMEFVAGVTLEERMRQCGALGLTEVLRVGVQVARGLAAAHAQGLVHRDVKPANVLLEGGSGRARLTDFGLARATDDASLSQSGVVAGTPLYMSPEQARGEAVDHRSDLASLGSVLYAVCTGRPPFRAPSTMAVLQRVCEDTPRPMREVNPDVPDWLAAIVMKLLAKDPARRFQAAEEVAELLEKHLGHLRQPHLVARPPGVVTSVSAPRRHLAILLVGAAVSVALTAAGLAGILLLGDRAKEAKPSGGGLIEPSPPSPRQSRAPEEVAKFPSPFDGRNREDIPRGLLALAGRGDPALAPTELVAMLGADQFHLPEPGLVGRMEESPDGSLLAVACGKTVVLFDARTGKYRKSLTGLLGRVFPVAFSPDGKSVAASCRPGDNRVKVWDVESGQETATFPGHDGMVWSVLFSRDGKRLYSTGQDDLVRVWDLVSKEELPPFAGHNRGGAALALSPDDKRLASADGSGRVLVWDTTSRELQKTLEGFHFRAAGLAFSPDGTLLATGDAEAISLWNTATWELSHTMASPAFWLAFADGGRTLLTAPIDQVKDNYYPITLWDVATAARKRTYTLNSREGYPAYCLSRDGKTLYSLRCNPPEPMIHRYDAATGKELLPHQGHAGAVLAVAVSPDGRTLASGGADHSVRVWDPADSRLLQTLEGHTDMVDSVAFSPDGRLLASGSTDRTVVLWDTTTWKKARTLAGHSRTPKLVVFSPDGRTVAAGQGDGGVRVWDVSTGQARILPRRHERAISALAFSPDGKLLASAGKDGTVQLGDVDARTTRQLGRPGGPVTNVAFGANGRTLAAVSEGPECRLHVWDVETSAELAVRDQPARACGLALHPNGRLAATGSEDGAVRFWDCAPGSPNVLTVSTGRSDEAVRQIAFTPEGRYLAAANDNGTVAVLRVPGPRPPYDPGPARKVPDPQQLAERPTPADALKRDDIPKDLLKHAGGGNGADAPAGLVAVLGGESGHRGSVRFLAVSPDGQTLASAGSDQTVRLWDLATGRLRRTLTGHRGVVSSLAFSPDGKLLASPGADGTVKLWDVAAGKELRTLTGPGTSAYCARFAPDGQTLASAGDDGAVRVWDVNTGQVVRTFPGVGPSKGWCACVAFSPKGQVLALGLESGVVRLLDLAGGWQLAELKGHNSHVRTVVFQPDGRTLVSCADDGTVRTWNLASAREMQTLEGHQGYVLDLAQGPTDRLLVSCGGQDGTVRVWDVTTTPAQCQVIRLFGAEAADPVMKVLLHGVALTPEGRYLITANPDGTVYVIRLARQGQAFGVGE